MSLVVKESGISVLRLNTWTRKSFASLRYMRAMGIAVPFTVVRPSPRPGIMIRCLCPIPKEI